MTTTEDGEIDRLRDDYANTVLRMADIARVLHESEARVAELKEALRDVIDCLALYVRETGCDGYGVTRGVPELLRARAALGEK